MSQQDVKAEYSLSNVTARIIGAAQEVHRTLGPGFEEVIYQLFSGSAPALRDV